MASLYWQVPVSDGYGRRMRFLVWDQAHGKLIGIFALGDAVFNQAARDAVIGWDHHRRSAALVNLMDAYVLGALPPYSHLLGGKLRSEERRVGKECVCTCRAGWSRYHKKKKTNNT